ncbi:MAG: sugar phosphate isomerase/epimerase family protein [Peptococcaceae bacterium]
MKDYQYSVGVWAFGSCLDRFCESGYQKAGSFAQKVAAAAKVKGLAGLEIHYNGDFTKSTAAECRKIIEESGLQVAAVNCEIFGDPQFKKGALISPVPETRQKAIDIIREAGEMAEYFAASLVNIWPGADGFDYPFQIDYFSQWELLMDSVKQVISGNPRVKFSFEYKLREPRIRSTVSTVGKALLITREAACENAGVTLDFGHSLMARENPADTAALLARYEKLFHVHVNDNSRDWDDDLIVNTYHFWETLEFIYYLKKCDYQGWLGFDMSPKREDQIKAVEYSIATVKRMVEISENLDTQELQRAFHDTDALSAHQYISQKILG